MKDDFKDASVQFNQMIDKFKEPSLAWLDKVEAEIKLDSRELTRRILQGHLNSKGSGDFGQAIITKDNIKLTRKRLFPRTLQTLFGAVSITRIGYSIPQHQNIFPFDALLNLPTSSFSYGLQRFIARRAAVTAFSEALNVTTDVTGVVIGKRQALKIIQDSSIDFDDYYAKKFRDSNNLSDLLVLTTDGKGIVMRHESLRDQAKKRAAVSSKKRQSNAKEKLNRKRMAQVASIYFIARFVRKPEDIVDELSRKKANSQRPRPTKKRVWASIEKNAHDTISEMFLEARNRDPKHDKEWVVLVDGNKQQIRLIKKFAKKEKIKVTIILDLIHLIEYLWDAAHVLIGESKQSECEQWVSEKLLQVINSNAGKVAGHIRMSAAKKKLTPEKQKTADACATYIANHKPYTHYAKYLEAGYPIATGVIEGACRYLIKDRMDITGARWSVLGAESILKLRSLVTSNDFDEYWDFHLQCEYARNYSEKIVDLEKFKDFNTSL